MGLFGRSFFFPQFQWSVIIFPLLTVQFIATQALGTGDGSKPNWNWGASPCRVDTAAMLDSPKGAPCMGAVHASKFDFFLLGDWVPEFHMGI